MVKISIVTISYNQAKYLETAIRSVIDQDYPALEYIIVDPGSTDGSREIIEKYSDRIHKIIFEPDEGPADGLNKGFAQATGDVFGYINADDVLLPNALRKVDHYFQSREEVDVLLGNGVQIDAGGNVTRKLFSSEWNVKRYAFGACAIVQQGNFFRKAAFKRVNGFNSSNRTCWDGELLVDLSLARCRFLKIHDFLGAFRLNPEATSRSGDLNHQYIMDHARIFEEINGRKRRWPDTIPSCFWRIADKLHRLSQEIVNIVNIL